MSKFIKTLAIAATLVMVGSQSYATEQLKQAYEDYKQTALSNAEYTVVSQKHTALVLAPGYDKIKAKAQTVDKAFIRYESIEQRQPKFTKLDKELEAVFGPAKPQGQGVMKLGDFTIGAADEQVEKVKSDVKKSMEKIPEAKPEAKKETKPTVKIEKIEKIVNPETTEPASVSQKDIIQQKKVALQLEQQRQADLLAKEEAEVAFAETLSEKQKELQEIFSGLSKENTDYTKVAEYLLAQDAPVFESFMTQLQAIQPQLMKLFVAKAKTAGAEDLTPKLETVSQQLAIAQQQVTLLTQKIQTEKMATAKASEAYSNFKKMLGTIGLEVYQGKLFKTKDKTEVTADHVTAIKK